MTKKYINMEEELMDTKRLEEIEAREKRSTAGPWNVSHAICCPDACTIDPIQGDCVYHTKPPYYGHTGAFSIEDADFISNAREDIPWLIEQVKSQAAEIDRLRGHIKLRQCIILEHEKINAELVNQIALLRDGALDPVKEE